MHLLQDRKPILLHRCYQYLYMVFTIFILKEKTIVAKVWKLPPKKVIPRTLSGARGQKIGIRDPVWCPTYFTIFRNYPSSNQVEVALFALLLLRMKWVEPIVEFYNRFILWLLLFFHKTVGLVWFSLVYPDILQRFFTKTTLRLFSRISDKLWLEYRFARHP